MLPYTDSDLRWLGLPLTNFSVRMKAAVVLALILANVLEARWGRAGPQHCRNFAQAGSFSGWNWSSYLHGKDSLNTGRDLESLVYLLPLQLGGRICLQATGGDVLDNRVDYLQADRWAGLKAASSTGCCLWISECSTKTCTAVFAARCFHFNESAFADEIRSSNSSPYSIFTSLCKRVIFKGHIHLLHRSSRLGNNWELEQRLYWAKLKADSWTRLSMLES